MFKHILLVASCALSLSAVAAEQVWDFDDGTLSGTNYGNTLDLDGLSVQGWSDTGTRREDETLANTRLSYSDYWGLMSKNQDERSGSPSHAIDSFGNDHDMVLLSFDQSVNLSGFTLGWAYEDYGYSSSSSADVSVLAYSGSDTPVLYGQTWDDLAGLGWTTEAEVADADEFAYQAIDSSASSKYWLIGAYNPIFGSFGWSDNNDAFKLAGAKATPGEDPLQPATSVPEPGTVMLLAMGLFGLALRKNKRQA
ncbi:MULTISPECIES: exosortase-dependent surface protein XDP1 [unclassified Agarivorans]|uniref:exosortase-dependent surface protein XDP1 n=1 Tax=unclassified Agarivorans TaxID=2636026 RepID=UPI003D7DFA10